MKDETRYLTLGAVGEVTIPEELREKLHLTLGTKIAVERDEFAIILHPITDQFIESLHGCTEGMGLSEEWAREHREYKAL